MGKAMTTKQTGRGLLLARLFLFAPVPVFAALDPFIFRRLCIGWYRPLVADLYGGNTALVYIAVDVSSVKLVKFAELRDRQVFH